MNEPEEFDISFDDVLSGTSSAPAEETPTEDPGKKEETPTDTLETPPAAEPAAETPAIETPAAETPETPPADTLETPEEPASDEASIVGEIKAHFGYELEDDYEDTPEGLQDLTKALAQKMSIENLDTIFDRFPTVKQHLEYVQQGGDPRQFLQAHTPDVEYASVNIKDEDTETQKALVEHYFTAKGDDVAFIQDRIEAYEDKGTLKDMATKAKTALAAHQARQRETMMEQQRYEAATREEEAGKVWGDVTEIVTKQDSINGLPIAQKERSKFLDYISKPIDRNGNTQRDIDSAQLTLEQQLGADYLLYKGMKLDSFIGKKAKTTAAANLRERMALNTKKAKGVKTVESATDDVVNSLDLNLDNF